MTSTEPWRGFASDNYASVHPDVMEAIARANAGHDVAYGDDAVTARLNDAVKDHFGPKAEAFPVFNGTGANVVALQAMTRRWEAVVCAASAHVNVDEGGAPEHGAGLKLWTIPTSDGKLTPDLLDTQAWGFGDVHRAQPGAVTITQSTELGTLYTIDEITALTSHAHSLGMRTHVDGARLSNAAASLGTGFKAFTDRCGSRCGVVRRHQERAHARRSGHRARCRGRTRGRLPAQVIDAVGQQDALRQRPAARAPH